MKIKYRQPNLTVRQKIDSRDFQYSELQKTILSTRISNSKKDPDQLARPRLKYLDQPSILQDIDKAAERIADALRLGEVIGLETDHDCDGQTSHAILYEALTKHFSHPVEKVRSYIGHRMQEGYGLSEALVTRILADENIPTLLITADNGSTDELRIAQLKQMADMDTIVTDHHAIPVEGIPKSAYAVINPTRSDCEYPDTAIAGCMVAWLLMNQVKLILGLSDSVDLKVLLDFVAVGTIADCVSMADSINNRAVVKYGMQLIQKQSRACWRVFADLFSNRISSELISFTIAPLLNSDGRLSDAMSSVNFLLCEDISLLQSWIDILQTQNTERKLIQHKITDEAMQIAQQQVSEGAFTIVVHLSDGHAGVHGISASRIKDHFGRPVIIFSPKEGDATIITGSARSLDVLNIKVVLDQMAEQQSDLFIKYGGHAGAAGMSILKSNIDVFRDLFEATARKYLTQEMIGPEIWVDQKLSVQDINFQTVQEIEQLEPYGRKFELPQFIIAATIMDWKRIGKDLNHVACRLRMYSQKNIQNTQKTQKYLDCPAIWFNVDKVLIDVFHKDDEVDVIFKLVVEYYKGRKTLKMHIITMITMMM